jgi:PTH1 family peptidyl-tRNA hydrolase
MRGARLEALDELDLLGQHRLLALELRLLLLVGERALLLLPGTYMNDSGRAVAEAAHFYKLGLSDIIVFHDEIDLAPGKLRVKTGGGIAGHNGLRSISAHIGNEYRRVRIGVGHPGVKDLVHPYVLNDFAKDERPWVEALCALVADNAELLAKGQDASFQNKVHLGMQAKGFLDPKQPEQPDE